LAVAAPVGQKAKPDAAVLERGKNRYGVGIEFVSPLPFGGERVGDLDCKLRQVDHAFGEGFSNDGATGGDKIMPAAIIDLGITPETRGTRGDCVGNSDDIVWMKRGGIRGEVVAPSSLAVGVGTNERIVEVE